jgi:hypothetical protein
VTGRYAGETLKIARLLGISRRQLHETLEEKKAVGPAKRPSVAASK